MSVAHFVARPALNARIRVAVVVAATQALMLSFGAFALACTAPALAPISVLVQYTYSGGTQPVGVTPSTLSFPAPQLEVDAVPAGDGSAAPVAVATTDDNGSAELDLSPGEYWLFVPQIGNRLQNGGTQLPDGTPVSGWVDVVVNDATPQTVAISILKLTQ